MLTKIPKGMKDVLPAESARWRAVEKECRQAALLAGYREDPYPGSGAYGAVRPLGRRKQRRSAQGDVYL